VVYRLIIGALLGLFLFAGQASAENTNTEFQQAYESGRSKGVITDENLSYSEFEALCKNSVFPAYLQAKKNDSTLTFQQYVAQDNYEVPEGLDDHPTTVSAGNTPSNNSKSTMMLRSAAHSSYDMKAGDILVVYGKNSDFTRKFIGHAAIACSSGYVMEMSGPGHNAWHSTKKGFFERNTGKNSYVYRIKAHPNYADSASTYAYKNMYLKDNPSYFISTNLYHKSPTYCSKYVYLSYWWGATKSALIYYKANTHIVTPHGLVGNFQGSFKPTNIHKITSY